MRRVIRQFFVAAAMAVGCAMGFGANGTSCSSGADDSSAVNAPEANDSCREEVAALAGKTLCVFGDSYVRNHRCPASETWHAKAAERLGMRYVNMGVNGSSVLYDRTAEGFGEAMTRRWRELPDSVDCLLIIAGHNDATMISSAQELARFADALRGMLADIAAAHPATRVGFVTPWHVDRPGFNEVIDTIRDVCAANGVEVFDAEAAGGIRVNDDAFREKYFQNGGLNDTAHLNDAGHDLIAAKGAAFIAAMMATDGH